MKKLLSTAVMFFLVSGAGLVYAHPPQDIQISYDAKTKMLSAVITHTVSDPVSHDIAKVDVGLNGSEVITQHFSRQDNNVTQTVAYLVPDAKSGDTLSVEAYCSISGKLEKSIKVKD